MIGGGEWKVDCKSISSMPLITINIAGTNFALKGEDYILRITEQGQTICLSAFEPMDTPTPFWVLGNAFIGKIYSVFDFDKKRVGFANANRV